jgi:protein phosphatase 1 regulatory subunit 11
MSGIVCCIYHAPKGIDESSDESSSDSSSDSDSDSGDDGAARPSRKEGVGHSHGGHGHGHDHGKPKKGKGRATSPNAYERMPKNNKTGGTKEKG